MNWRCVVRGWSTVFTGHAITSQLTSGRVILVDEAMRHQLNDQGCQREKREQCTHTMIRRHSSRALQTHFYRESNLFDQLTDVRMAIHTIHTQHKKSSRGCTLRVYAPHASFEQIFLRLERPNQLRAQHNAGA